MSAEGGVGTQYDDLAAMTAQQARLEAAAHYHYEGVADARHTYYSFHGWVLTCAWCDFETRAKIKAYALQRMQEHYDDVMAHRNPVTTGPITVRSRGRQS